MTGASQGSYAVVSIYGPNIRGDPNVWRGIADMGGSPTKMYSPRLVMDQTINSTLEHGRELVTDAVSEVRGPSPVVDDIDNNGNSRLAGTAYQNRSIDDHHDNYSDRDHDEVTFRHALDDEKNFGRTHQAFTRVVQ